MPKRLTPIEDEQLVILCKTQDVRAQSKLYNHYSSYLHWYLRKRWRIQDDTLVDDVIIKTLEVALRNIHQFDQKSSLASWLIGICKFRVLDYIDDKKRKRITPLSFHESYEPFAQHQVTYNDGDSNVGFHRYMEIIQQTLTKKELQVFMLTYEGYQHREIGNHLNIAEGTSKWHLNAARVKLKSKFAGVI